MSARTRAIRRKAEALFYFDKSYTFRQISVSYRFWKSVLDREVINSGRYKVYLCSSASLEAKRNENKFT